MSICCDNIPVIPNKITRGALWGVYWWTDPVTPLDDKVIEIHVDNIETETRAFTIVEPLGTGSDDYEDDYTGVTVSDDYEYMTIKISSVATENLLSNGKYLLTLMIDNYVTDKVVVEVETLPGGLA